MEFYHLNHAEEGIAKNPNTSPDMLRKILEGEKEGWVSRYAARNPNCPLDVLKMILEKGKNDMVSWGAAKNPNCPTLSKIKWMRATGQIGVEDPSKHFIEYDEPKVDEDLQKLRELASN